MAVLISAFGFQNCLNSNRSGLSGGATDTGLNTLPPPPDPDPIDNRAIVMDLPESCDIEPKKAHCPLTSLSATATGITSTQRIVIKSAKLPNLSDEYLPYDNANVLCFASNSTQTKDFIHPENDEVSTFALGYTYKFTAFKVKKCTDAVAPENEISSVTITPTKEEDWNSDVGVNGDIAIYASDTGACVGKSDALIFSAPDETGIAKYCATGFSETDFWATAVVGVVSCADLEGNYINVTKREGDDGWIFNNGLWLGELEIGFHETLTLTSCFKASEDSTEYVRSITTFMRN
jgi:hypothetical protein